MHIYGGISQYILLYIGILTLVNAQYITDWETNASYVGSNNDNNKYDSSQKNPKPLK